MTKAVDTHETRREHREGPLFAQNFKDATRASVTTRGKQREGRRSCPEFRGCFTRQRHGAPERARRSPLTSRISRTLHAPASRRTGNSEKVATCRHLRPKFRECSTRQRHDAPKTTRGWPLTPENFEDAPFASVTTRGRQREGRHLRSEFRGRSTLQRHDAPKTTRGSPLESSLSRMLPAPASRRAENNERVAAYARFMRQRHDAPETARRSPLTPTISRMLHAPASQRAGNSEKVATCGQNCEDAPCASFTMRGKQRECRHLRPELRGRSMRQCHDAPKNNERVAQSFEDTLHASVKTRRPTDLLPSKQKERRAWLSRALQPRLGKKNMGPIIWPITHPHKTPVNGGESLPEPHSVEVITEDCTWMLTSPQGQNVYSDTVLRDNENALVRRRLHLSTISFSNCGQNQGSGYVRDAAGKYALHGVMLLCKLTLHVDAVRKSRCISGYC